MPQQIDFQPIDFQPEATPPPAWALQRSLQTQSTPDDLIDPNDVLLGASAHSRWTQTKEHPVQTLAMLAIPSVLGAVGKYGPPAIRSGANVLSNFLTKPAGGATVGAVSEGIRTKGDVRSMAYGAAAGAGITAVGGGQVSKLLKRVGLGGPDPVAAGMSQAGAAAAQPELPPALAALMRGANYDELAATMKPQATQAAPRPAMTPQQQLRQEIDWRTTDAVPIDAMKRKGIIEAGESRVGLSERMAQLLKEGTPQAMAEAERLARALRQRMHIGGER